MLDNEKTILLARELAKALQASDVYKEFELARQANDEDEALQDAIGSFNVAQMNLEVEREKDSPDTGAIARYTEDMQNAYKAVMGNPNVSSFEQGFLTFEMPFLFDDLEHQKIFFETSPVVPVLFKSTDKYNFTILTYFTAGTRNMQSAAKGVGRVGLHIDVAAVITRDKTAVSRQIFVRADRSGQIGPAAGDTLLDEHSARTENDLALAERDPVLVRIIGVEQRTAVEVERRSITGYQRLVESGPQRTVGEDNQL